MPTIREKIMLEKVRKKFFKQKWGRKLKAQQIIPNPINKEEILVVRLKMKHITEKQAEHELKHYLEEKKDINLELLDWDQGGEIKLYLKKRVGIFLRFKIVE